MGPICCCWDAHYQLYTEQEEEYQRFEKQIRAMLMHKDGTACYVTHQVMSTWYWKKMSSKAA